jgi:beta-glucosidase
MPWINHPNIKAVLWPGLPGQESGNAFADIVLGKENPSGRIPYTIAKEYADYPLHPDAADTVSNTILVYYYKKNILTHFFIFSFFLFFLCN